MTTETDTTRHRLQDEIRREPARAQITLKARAGTATQTARPEVDHVQRVLEALAGSLAATYRRFAAALDIPLTDVEIRVEAGLDLNGIAAADDGVRAGPSHVRAEARLTSSADIYDLERLRITIERHDPILDLLRHATPTRLEISINLRDSNPLAA
ncbi:OsmC family protein [Dongia rigui]|uniref:OsmC family protein n=1 Tax=Dongia rigui TaxID=940149 RepID=A0ABU5E2L6_9PROT|nr:OsmC family protein [Dongia rigui]MDY0873061.1 OsmC family protein [Dongia rigui]